MTTKIRKWGNSYAVRIPKYVVDKSGLREGSTVEIDIKQIKKSCLNGPVAQITITPVFSRLR